MDRAGERDVEAVRVELVEVEGDRDSRGEPVEAALREVEPETERDPHEEGLTDTDRVLSRDTVSSAVREFDTVTDGELEVRLLSVPETEPDGVLVAFALLGEIDTVAAGDTEGDRELEGLPVPDMSAEVARGVGEWQLVALGEPVWEGLPEDVADTEGLGDAEGERVEFEDREGLREALADVVMVLSPEVAAGDLEDEEDRVREGVAELVDVGAAMVRVGVMDVRSDALSEAEPLIERDGAVDVDAEAEAAADGDRDADAEALHVT